MLNEDISDFLEWGGGNLCGDHQLRSYRFGGHGLTISAAFFFGLPVAGLGAAVGFGSGFSGLAVLLVAITIGCPGATITS